MKKLIKHKCKIYTWSNNDTDIWGYCTCGKKISIDKERIDDIKDRAIDNYKRVIRTMLGIE